MSVNAEQFLKHSRTLEAYTPQRRCRGARKGAVAVGRLGGGSAARVHSTIVALKGVVDEKLL